MFGKDRVDARPGFEVGLSRIWSPARADPAARCFLRPSMQTPLFEKGYAVAADPMTEARWLGSVDPFPILQWVWGRLSDRRGRLIGCAGCRHVTHLITDPRTTGALEVAERFADAEASSAELEAAHKGATKAQNAQKRKALLFAYAAVMDASAPWRSPTSGHGLTAGALTNAVRAKVLEAEPRLGYAHLQRDRPAAFTPMADLVREVVGNPFRPVAIDPAWLTPTVEQLARGTYAERAFDRLPVLADALQDAGCDNDDVLNHCRGPGPHVRGCWVVDLVLGKE